MQTIVAHIKAPPIRPCVLWPQHQRASSVPPIPWKTITFSTSGNRSRISSVTACKKATADTICGAIGREPRVEACGIKKRRPDDLHPATSPVRKFNRRSCPAARPGSPWLSFAERRYFLRRSFCAQDRAEESPHMQANKNPPNWWVRRTRMDPCLTQARAPRAELRGARVRTLVYGWLCVAMSLYHSSFSILRTTTCVSRVKMPVGPQ
jgi:hypothetical protein